MLSLSDLERTCAVDFFDTWASTGALERCNLQRPLWVNWPERAGPLLTLAVNVY